VATFGRATTTSAPTSPVSIMIPPIVGVPVLIRCVCGSSSRTNCPNLRDCKNSMNFEPSITVTRNATAAASTTLNKTLTLSGDLAAYHPRPRLVGTASCQ